MTQIEKLEKVISEWEEKAMDTFKEANFCRNHNFTIQAQILTDKEYLINQICRSIRLKVIDEIIDP